MGSGTTKKKKSRAPPATVKTATPSSTNELPSTRSKPTFSKPLKPASQRRSSSPESSRSNDDDFEDDDYLEDAPPPSKFDTRKNDSEDDDDIPSPVHEHDEEDDVQPHHVLPPPPPRPRRRRNPDKPQIPVPDMFPSSVFEKETPLPPRASRSRPTPPLPAPRSTRNNTRLAATTDGPTQSVRTDRHGEKNPPSPPPLNDEDNDVQSYVPKPKSTPRLPGKASRRGRKRSGPPTDDSASRRKVTFRNPPDPESLDEDTRTTKIFVLEDCINEMKTSLEMAIADKKMVFDYAQKLKSENEKLSSEMKSMRTELSLKRSTQGTVKLRKSRRASIADELNEDGERDMSSLSRRFTAGGVPADLLTSFINMYRNMNIVADYLVTESYEGSFFADFTPIKWFPNYVGENSPRCRDWRHKIELLDDTNSIIGKDAEKKDIEKLGTFFMLCQKDKDNLDKEVRLCVPVCPMEESRVESFFTCRDDLLADVIGHMTMNDVRRNNSTLSPSRLASCSTIASGNVILLKRLGGACSDQVGIRKRAFRTTYFDMLGYGAIVAPARRSEAEAMKERRSEELASAYEKLYEMGSDGIPNTSRWRLASFEDLCAESATPDVVEERSFEKDLLFNNEAARIAFESFRGYSVSASEDATITTLIRADAWMTAVIEDFKRKKDGVRKGGAEPTVLRNRFCFLLPVAAEHVLASCRNAILQAIRKEPSNSQDVQNTVAEELGILKKGTMPQRLRNNARNLTTAFQYPINNHIYIAVRPTTFSKYICSWYGFVRDCYIMHYGGSDKNGALFKAKTMLSVDQDSDYESAE